MTPPPRLARFLPAVFLLLLILPSMGRAQEDGIVQKLYENALQLLHSGKSEEAMKGFQQIYGDFPKAAQVPDALYQAASFYYSAGSLDDLGVASRDAFAKAGPLLDRIRKEHNTSPRAPEALYKQGLMSLEPENPKASFDEAYAAFTSVANVYPTSPLAGPALFAAAMTQVRAGAFPAALEDFGRLLERYPDLPAAPRARLAYAYCLYKTDDFPRAMEEYQRVRDDFPDKPEAKEALNRLTLLHRLRLAPSAGRPIVYRLEAEFPGRLEALGLRSVTALAMAPSGSLLVADDKQGIARQVDPAGRASERIVFAQPMAAAVDRQGAPVLAGGGNVLLGNRQQALVRPDGSSARPVKEVSGAAVDRDGRLAVGDAKTGEVLIYGRSLEFKGPVLRTSSGRLGEIRAGPDNEFYILDTREKSVTVYSLGRPPLRIRLDEAPASIGAPVSLAVDSLGDLYVCDSAAGRVVVLDPSGKRVLSNLQSDRTKGGLSAPERVEVDGLGRIYVYDRKADAILRFR